MKEISAKPYFVGLVYRMAEEDNLTFSNFDEAIEIFKKEIEKGKR